MPFEFALSLRDHDALTRLQMMRAHRANTEEDDKMAVNTARTLVEDADAPLLVRARKFSIPQSQAIAQREMHTYLSFRLFSCSESSVGCCRSLHLIAYCFLWRGQRVAQQERGACLSTQVIHVLDIPRSLRAVCSLSVVLFADLSRLGACMVLRCSTEDDYFVWATEAVRTAELILEVTSNVGEAEEKLMASCRKVLEAAEQSKKEQEEHDKREAAKEDGEVETKATDQGDEEGEGEG